MIGRGSFVNPWLIMNTVNYLEGKPVIEIGIEEKIDMILKHLKYLEELKNEKLACLEIRNHISWYLKGVKNSNDLKNKIYKTDNIRDIIFLLKEFKEEKLWLK